jgi:hypothetical protein
VGMNTREDEDLLTQVRSRGLSWIWQLETVVAAVPSWLKVRYSS